MAHATTHSDSPDYSHHIVPIPVYFVTFLALGALMLMTVGASYVHFPGGTATNNLIALAIAVTKAALVVGVFMNVRNGTKLIKMWALIGFVWFTLFFIMFADYKMREFEQVVPWNAKDPGSAMSRGWEGEQGPTDPNMVNVRPRR
jgi:caa(3)-type oxidase subunit IV